jgi:hypothetical protein
MWALLFLIGKEATEGGREGMNQQPKEETRKEASSRPTADTIIHIILCGRNCRTPFCAKHNIMTNYPKATTAGDVLLYIPNLIGYLRVACTLLSLILMICFPRRWIIAIILYVSSFVGDLFDGLAARKLDQCSLFGGLLDMVTDRCSTTGLLCALSREHTDRPMLVLVRKNIYIYFSVHNRYLFIHSLF